MPLLHRMGLAQKFLVLGVMALVMVLVPTAMYFKYVVAEVQFAERENSGTHSVVLLNKVVQLTQTHPSHDHHAQTPFSKGPSCCNQRPCLCTVHGRSQSNSKCNQAVFAGYAL